MKSQNERYEKISELIYNSEDLLDYTQWYADKLKLTYFIDEFNNEIESDVKEQIDRLRRVWDSELDKPTRNWYKYTKESENELKQANNDYIRSVI